jgi:site-specific DNA-methyltransferase (adenine-specific)
MNDWNGGSGDPPSVRVRPALGWGERAKVTSAFYDDGVCEVWQGDARRLPLADESVDLIVTSPPYNARIVYDGYEDWLPWETYWQGLIVPSMRECFRVLRHGGRLAVNMANVVRQDVPQAGRNGRPTQYQPRESLPKSWHGKRKWTPPGANGDSWALMVGPRLWHLLEDDLGFLPREQLTWAKAENAQDIGTHSLAWGTYRSARNPVLRAVCEPVFIASKGTHSRGEPRPGQDDLTPAEFKAWTRNVWTIPATNPDSLGHPAVFPLELPRRLIKLYSYVGDVVLDPFCGSGTTLRAAKDVGRRAIGVDISPRYVALSANRCRQDLLFSPGEGVA